MYPYTHSCLLCSGNEECRGTLFPAWFKLPIQTSGGFGIYSIGRNRILGAESGLLDHGVGFQISSDKKDDIRIKVKGLPTTVNYRLFNMVIGKLKIATAI